jgi:hypothetical protein
MLHGEVRFWCDQNMRKGLRWITRRASSKDFARVPIDAEAKFGASVLQTGLLRSGRLADCSKPLGSRDTPGIDQPPCQSQVLYLATASG